MCSDAVMKLEFFRIERRWLWVSRARQLGRGVKMTEARTADLWLKIDQLHLRFLQVVLNSEAVRWLELSSTIPLSAPNFFLMAQNVFWVKTFDAIYHQAEETPAKLELRNKLEGNFSPSTQEAVTLIRCSVVDDSLLDIEITILAMVWI